MPPFEISRFVWNWIFWLKHGCIPIGPEGCIHFTPYVIPVSVVGVGVALVIWKANKEAARA